MSKDKKKEFHETLTELVEYATVNGNHLTLETIQDYFRDFTMDESQYTFLYEYLTGLKITIDGFLPKETTTPDTPAVASAPLPEKHVTETEEAGYFYRMYLEELDALKPSQDEKNIEQLLQNLLAGDAESINTLTEYYLPSVINIATTLSDHGLSNSELVAEGNLALYESILSFSKPDATRAEFESYLFSSIERALYNAINEEIGSNRISDRLTDQVNALNDASTEFAKEYEREATLEELCERLSLSEDEVKELMKVSINALTVVQTTE